MTAATAEALYMTENGAILCKQHRPSSDFHTSRLRPAEVAEWRVLLVEMGHPADAPLCEICRVGQ